MQCSTYIFSYWCALLSLQTSGRMSNISYIAKQIDSVTCGAREMRVGLLDDEVAVMSIFRKFSEIRKSENSAENFRKFLNNVTKVSFTFFGKYICKFV